VGDNVVGTFVRPYDPALAATGSAGATAELRGLVSGLHARGLEVLVHVVLTQLGEGTDEEPASASLRGRVKG
jgi:pullulanase/glycogen debranching enzyme